ncbi:MAG: transporter substrate-binding domain-containing protein [Parachlamydiaceae bacterium]|nr:transporter substrate-binding domain-containing protein [Parachlamydiaceae bacterium]
MIKKILILLSCLGISLLYAKENHLVVGTNAEFPPFCFIEDNKIIGFDIDIANEVGKRLGKTIEFKDIPFDALIPAVNLGQVDFVAAGISYTEERAKRVLFTKPYLSDDPLVILTMKQPFSLDDLKNKSVIVIEGFTADDFMSSILGINLIRLPTQADGFMALKSGRADAFVTAKSTVDTFFEMQDPSQYFTTTLEGTGETCALMIPKKKAALLVDIQIALDEMEKDGTMIQLKTKWKLR